MIVRYDSSDLGTVAVLELDRGERESLRAAVSGLVELDADIHSVDGVIQAILAQSCVAHSVRAAILNERFNGEVLAVSIRPVIRPADLPTGPTPEHWSQADGPDTSFAAWTGLLVGSMFGVPIGWSSQQAGRIVTDVVPTPGMEQSKVSSSSHEELTWHTEDAFHPERADWVGLLALRNPDNVVTTIGAIPWTHIDHPHVEILTQPRFSIRADDAHENPDAGGRSEVALLEREHDELCIRADRDFTTVHDPDDEAARDALRWLFTTVDANLTALPIEVGTMTFLNNRRAVHGRAPFRPRFDGTDRWLKRVNIADVNGRIRLKSTISNSLVLER